MLYQIDNILLQTRTNSKSAVQNCLYKETVEHKVNIYILSSYGSNILPLVNQWSILTKI